MEKKQTKADKQKRALKYAMSMLAIQEVGMGPDKNLSLIRQVVEDIKHLCISETGIELNGYPNEFVKEHLSEKDVANYIPLTAQRMLKIGQWEDN